MTSKSMKSSVQGLLIALAPAALLSGCGDQPGAVSTPSVPGSVREKLSDVKADVKEKAGEAKEVVADKVDSAKKAVENIELPKLPEIDAFKGDFTKLVGSLTETLGSVKDAGTAESAIAKLKDAAGGIDAVKALTDKIPASAKEAVKKFIAQNVGTIKDLATKALAAAGANGEKLRPVIEPLVSKLEALTK